MYEQNGLASMSLLRLYLPLAEAELEEKRENKTSTTKHSAHRINIYIELNGLVVKTIRDLVRKMYSHSLW